MVESETAVEREGLAANPREERAELAASLVQRGVAPALAEEVAAQMSENPDEALRFHALEELGVDPGQLTSPYEATGLSFISFAIGAAVPLVPFLLGASVLWPSLAATTIALALSGGIVARLTRRPIALGAVRQVALAVSRCRRDLRCGPRYRRWRVLILSHARSSIFADSRLTGSRIQRRTISMLRIRREGHAICRLIRPEFPGETPLLWKGWSHASTEEVPT